MYPVSELYKSKIKELERTFEARIQIQHSLGVLHLTDADIVGGSLAYNESSQAGDDFTIGGTVASNLSITILNKPEYADFDFAGATITASVGLQVGTGFEYVPLGVFNIDDVGKQRNSIKLKAIDNMIKFDKPYHLSSLGYPATLLQIYIDACNVCDVMPAMGSFTNSNYIVQERPDDDLTFRDIIGYIAELSGSFARMNRAGALEFAWYTDSGVTLTGANRFNFIPRDDLVQIKGVMATVDGTTYLAGTDEYAVDLSENPLLQGDYETILPIVYNKIKDTAFYPFESSWQGNPAMQAGDVITQIDRDGKAWATLVTSSTYKYRGASTLVAKGLPIIAKGFKGSTNRKIAEIKRRIEKDVGDKLTTLEQAQLHNTELIANMLGGYVIDEEGALYIADNPDLEQAIRIWKWGLGGFGYSSTGVEGPYTTSISADGSIVAMLVAANIITADMVQTGELRSVDGSTRINLDDGTFNFKDVLKWENEKLRIASPDINPLGIVNDEHVTAYFPFDGSLAATNGIQPTFSRNSEAYAPDGTKMGVNQPRFGQGRFDQAVLVEEGTTNQIANPLTFSGWGTSDTVEDNDGTFHPLNAKFIRVKNTAWGCQSNSIPASNGQTWSVSFIARKGTGDGEPKAAIMIMNPNNGHVSNILPSFSSKDIRNGWVRHEATFTINYADTGYICLRFYVTATNGGYHDFALPQLEQKPYPTSFTDNTRAVEGLRIPTAGVLDPTEGTISFFVRPNIVTDWNNFCSTSVTNGRFLLYFSKNGDAKFDYGTSNQGVIAPNTIKEGVWQHIAIRWSASTNKQAIFVNGVKYEKDLTNGVSDSFSSNMNVVVNYSALIDDLRISSVARTDEEIRAYYESQKPFFDSGGLVRTTQKYNNVEISAEVGVRATHKYGEYTQLDGSGLTHFIPEPIYTETPTGVPNTEGFEAGVIPLYFSGSGISISSVARTGTKSLMVDSNRVYRHWRADFKVTKDGATVSFWYRRTGTDVLSYAVALDGVRMGNIVDTGTWTQFVIPDVPRGRHELCCYCLGAGGGSDYLYFDDFVFESNPVVRSISGYSPAVGHKHVYGVHIGSASTGTFWTGSPAVPQPWIQLPEFLRDKEFTVFLSLKDFTYGEGIDEVRLEVIDIDKTIPAFRVLGYAAHTGSAYPDLHHYFPVGFTYLVIVTE